MQIYEVFQAPNSQYSKVNQPSSINYNGLTTPGATQAQTTTATPPALANPGDINFKKGFWSSFGNYAKRRARNYMASKTGLPADVFKNEKERKEEEKQAELRNALNKAAKATKGSAPAGQSTSNSASTGQSTANSAPADTTTSPSTANSAPATIPVNYNVPAYQRKGQVAPVTTPAPATPAPVNYNVPAYQRKGQIATTTVPSNDLLKKATASLQGGPALSAQELKQVNDYRVSKGAKPIPTPTAPASVEPSAQQSAVGVTQINQIIPKIRTRDLNSIKKNIDAVLAKRQKPGVTAAPASATANMASQLANKPVASSTGGKIATTPTGLVHTAKQPAQPIAAKSQYKGGQPKVSATPPAGAPTSAEYANLDQRLQQALAAQGQRV